MRIIILSLALLMGPCLAIAEQPLLRLPYPETDYEQHVCTQGPHGTFTHNDTGTQYDIDVATPPTGDPEPILAAAAGTAFVCPCPSPCPTTGYGNNARIRHAPNLFSFYAHLKSFALDSGEVVEQGDTIAFEDSTGRSTADHIHFGIHEGDARNCSGVGKSVPIEAIEVIDQTLHTGPITITGDEFLCGDPDGTRHRYLSTNPRPVVIAGVGATEGLTIAASEFVIGATLTARFRFKNQSDVPITLRNIVVGGRLNGVDDCSNYPGTCPDFSAIQGPIVLAPGATYDYFGTFEPILAGSYKFDIYWRIPDDQTDLSYGWMYGPPVDPSPLRNEFTATILAVCTEPLQARGVCLHPSPTITRVPSHRPTSTPPSATPIATLTADVTFTAGTSTTASPTLSQPTTTPSPFRPCPDDERPCTEELLIDGVCTHRKLPDFSSCDDGVFCNGRELCHDSICGGPGYSTGAACPAPDGDEDCSESCDEAAHNCKGPDPNGSICMDGVFCNGQDFCQQGTCSGHAGDPCEKSGQSCNQALDECDEPPDVSSPTPTPMWTNACVGDCSGDGRVTVDEVIRGINIALGNANLDECAAFDCHGSNTVRVDCLVQGVKVALVGCTYSDREAPAGHEGGQGFVP